MLSMLDEMEKIANPSEGISFDMRAINFGLGLPPDAKRKGPHIVDRYNRMALIHSKDQNYLSLIGGDEELDRLEASNPSILQLQDRLRDLALSQSDPNVTPAQKAINAGAAVSVAAAIKDSVTSNKPKTVATIAGVLAASMIANHLANRYRENEANARKVKIK